METIQAIRSRRSIRKYQPKPVSHEVIEQIVTDAAYAPSWKNTQIARYVLVEDRATIDKMAEEDNRTRSNFIANVFRTRARNWAQESAQEATRAQEAAKDGR